MAIEIRTTKDGRKSYRAVLYKNHRKLAVKSFKRKFDATQWLEQKENQLRLGKSARITFSEAIDLWLGNHANLKLQGSTVKIRQYRLHKTIAPFFVGRYLDDISPEDIDRLVVHLKTIPAIKTNSTINDYLKVLSAVLGYFVKRRYIAFNPAQLVERLPQENLTINYMSFDEKNAFLEHAERKYRHGSRWVYAAYVTLLTTGLRWGEFVALQWDRIDLARRIITVSRTHCKTTLVLRERTKSGALRYVGINSDLSPLMATLHHGRKPDIMLVFHNKNGGVLNLSDFKRDHFAKDLQECGLRHFRIHDLRHTFASHFVMLGGDLYKLQALLGHGSLRMTEHYAHLSPSSLVNETELLVQGAKLKAINGGAPHAAPHMHPTNEKAPSPLRLSA